MADSSLFLFIKRLVFKPRRGTFLYELRIGSRKLVYSVTATRKRRFEWRQA